MEWISTWIQGIIVAVMISTIIEMILPEGNCKKYIKVVIGVYILASIISPVVTKITGNQINLSSIFDLDEYIEASSPNSHQDLSKSQEEQIQDIYQNSLKSDMKQKIEAKGYKVLNITLQISDNGQYTIEKMELELAKKEIEQEDEQNRENEAENSNNQSQEINGNPSSSANKSENNVQIQVNKIEEIAIQVGSTKQENTQKTTQSTLTLKEKSELKQYLSSVYEIPEKNISIN